MVTDDERREVTRRLRDSWRPRWHGEKMMHRLREALGIDQHVSTFGKFRYYRAVAERLADLIEPSASATPTPLRRDTDASATLQPSQRDALLALADEMDAYTGCDDERCGRDMPPRAIHDYARRIREALGVEE